jgi:hypothetical protein
MGRLLPVLLNEDNDDRKTTAAGKQPQDQKKDFGGMRHGF